MRVVGAPGASLRGALGRIGRQMRWASALRGGSVWTATVLGVWLGVFLADNVLRLPSGLRLPLVVAALVVTAANAWRRLGGAFRRIPPERAARELERRCGIDDNLLINACQFESAGENAWTDGLVSAARGRTATVDSAVVWNPAAMRRTALWLVGLALAWGLYVGVWPHRAANAWARLVRPLSDAPPLGSVRIETLPATDVALYEGDALRIEARIVGEVFVPPPLLRRKAMRGGGNALVSEPMGVDDAEGTPTGVYVADLRDLRESFVFTVAAGGTWSRPVRITVRTLPRVVASTFRVAAPAYMGLPPLERPGVPQSLSGPTGSTARVFVQLDPDVSAVDWCVGDTNLPLARTREGWTGEFALHRDDTYALEVEATSGARRLRVAEGSVFVEPDRAPSVAIEGVEPNRTVWPGDELALDVVASDDHGLASLWLEARGPEAAAEAGTAEAGTEERALRRWTYAGPPGTPDAMRERHVLTIDPQRFPPGEAVVVEARARDFNPAGGIARSLPVVLRVMDPRVAPLGAAPDVAADALAKAIEAQRRALGLTRNLALHLTEALADASVPRHVKGMTDAQSAARTHGQAAGEALRASKRGDPAERLETLVRHEMGWALDAITQVAKIPAADFPERLASLSGRQYYILNELLTLLGQLRSRGADAGRGGTPPATVASLRDAAELLRDQLKDFAEVQKRIVKETLPLGRKGPEDLTGEEEDILGRLAREEERQAAFLKDAVDDFSKLPMQDFADGSLADKFHTVYQEVAKAAAALYEKKIELAVPLEQSGLEMAEELVHNLEKWLSDTPDHTKWLMEEPPDMPLPPMAELPDELEDIVGELLDEEQAMNEDIEDVTSSWSDSLDKGAGWDVSDGPISDMSAKAVTGNLLPNQMEIGGRAGEGRSGRSHGQMVESEAVGKGGRQTPTRVTPSPFEAGSVKDQSEEDPGGSTGGGKLSGFAGQGLRGPSPTPRLDKMARLAGKQAEIRQDAERLSLHLRAWQAPSGDIDSAVAAMRKVEALARAGQGGGIRQAYDETLDAMRLARTAIAAEAAVRREKAPAGRDESEELWTALREQLPAGYEEMAAAYFRRLAEGYEQGGRVERDQ